MRFALFFIDRPVFASAVSIVTVIVGAIAMVSLPISQYPEIAPPTVIVSASFPGANAKTVAETVATPIEQQINGVEGMLYMSSQSTNDGNMKLTVTFKLGTNLDIAQVQVQNRVTIAQPQIPPEVVRAGIVVKKSSPAITLGMAIYSPDGSRDLLYLSNYTTLQIKDELARLEGVGDLQLFGVRDYSMRLWLNPDQMASRNITPGDFISAIQEQNVQVAAGIIGGPPLPKGMAQFQYTANAQGRLVKKEEFAEIIIKTGSDGKITRVKDVARVELGAADYSSGTTFNGKPAVGVAVFQLPGSNSIATANNIYKKMNELKKGFPKGVDYSIPYDTTLFVRDSIRDVVKTLFEAIALVALVVLVFLQSWRAAIVPLLAIPVSLVGTFAVMWFFNFSLNNLSLFGLVLSIGIVVDDAIVVVENVDRWIETGLSPREASYRAMTEVTPAIIAIGFGLTAVFVPVAFISGIQGQFYRQFALTISFATILSAVNSLTLSPALAALILKPHAARQDRLTRAINFLFGWFFWIFNRVLGTVNTAYVWTLRRVVRLAALVLAVYCGLLVLTYFLFQAVPFGFIPQQDQGYLITAVVLPDGASIERTEGVTLRLSEMANKTKGVRGTFAITGFNLFTNTNQTNAATIFLPLDSFKTRTGDPAQNADALVGNLMGQFSQVQEAFALVLSPPPVQGIGNASGFKMQIEDRTGLGTPQQLAAATAALMADARKDPRLTSLFSTYRASVPQVWVNVDRTKAKKAKVSITDLFQALQVYLGSFYINDFNFLGRTYKVIVQGDAVYRASAADIARIKTRNASGDMVPLGTVMDLTDVADADRINRYNLYPSAEINGAGGPGVSGNQAIEIMAALAKKNLPVGYSFEWTELAYQEETAGNTAIFIFPLCILFVFLTHAAEYESFALSTAIILIVPMCLLCGIAGVYFSKLDNNIFTQIGFVVLAGLSVKNAVLIVEFAKQQQEHHPALRARDAAIEASRLRLRPILMTSFAFIFGVFPLLIATGAGAEMRQALGTVVFYGMLGVTFFGVFLTPVFYTVIRRLCGDKPFHSLGEEPKSAH
ncbi:efflux RND transporter permease subunit [Frigoriglobus tundricola]|uniref:RND efflux system, inner membrane transporter n=1 Tax=Frigoriglobus tundricola TaxID=2774151 RepID=A0A6M5YR75_9BACT|nr:multidrug efflux RND transporter permease subunit [Frigoriglobus tundricola]QJW95751.1 RND efflux system, inner membrane transporter [Frigoriglobus tundricola]